MAQIVPLTFGDEQINLDDAVSVTCVVNKGDLPIQIEWMFQGSEEYGRSTDKRLTTNDGVVITRTNARISMLSIEAVKSRHRGNYTCLAKNNAGFVQNTAQLAINGYFILKFQTFPFSKMIFEALLKDFSIISEFCNDSISTRYSSSTNPSFQLR